MPAAPKPHPAAILVENLAPMVGVLFFGWSVAPVMVVYWIENGLRGLDTAARLALSRGGAAESTPAASLLAAADDAAPPPGPPLPPSLAAAGRLALVGFFLVHYGIFWAVHGAFVFLLFVRREPLGPFGGPPPGGPPGLPTGQVTLAAAVIAATLAATFVRDELLAGPRGRSLPIGLMARAYGRVIVLHVALLAGGFALMLLGSPTPALVLLIALKTAAELGALRLDGRAPAA